MQTVCANYLYCSLHSVPLYLSTGLKNMAWTWSDHVSTHSWDVIYWCFLTAPRYSLCPVNIYVTLVNLTHVLWYMVAWMALCCIYNTFLCASLLTPKECVSECEFVLSGTSITDERGMRLDGTFLPAVKRFLTFLRLIIPSFVSLSVDMENMLAPSELMMLYLMSALMPRSSSLALIFPTGFPIWADSGTYSW